MMTQVALLHKLTTEQAVEAANRVLAAKLEIDDPAAAAERVTELAGLPADKAKELAERARRAAQSDPDLLRELVVNALDYLAEEEPQEAEAIRQSAEAAGEKQTVVGLDIIALGYLLFCGYIVFARGGTIAREKKITVKEEKDGRLNVTIGEKETFLNPLSPLGNLIQGLWPKGD